MMTIVATSIGQRFRYTVRRNGELFYGYTSDYATLAFAQAVMSKPGFFEPGVEFVEVIERTPVEGK
jgi:hypothetical protein